jgi:hypothetical protein
MALPAIGSRQSLFDDDDEAGTVYLNVYDLLQQCAPAVAALLRPLTFAPALPCLAFFICCICKDWNAHLLLQKRLDVLVWGWGVSQRSGGLWRGVCVWRA